MEAILPTIVIHISYGDFPKFLLHPNLPLYDEASDKLIEIYEIICQSRDLGMEIFVIFCFSAACWLRC